MPSWFSSVIFNKLMKTESREQTVKGVIGKELQHKWTGKPHEPKTACMALILRAPVKRFMNKIPRNEITRNR